MQVNLCTYFVSVLPTDTWLPYVYQYGVMLLFFVFGLVICWKQGDIGFSSRRRLKNLGMLVLGFLFFMGLHGYFQFGTPPEPSQIHGEPNDRFFVRVFTPLGEPEQTPKGWKQKFRVQGKWIHCPDGKEETVYVLEQQIDAGAPGLRYEKICAVFNEPLTDWHDNVLAHFEENGFRFQQIGRDLCMPACKQFGSGDFEACVENCVEQCKNQYMKVYLGNLK